MKEHKKICASKNETNWHEWERVFSPFEICMFIIYDTKCVASKNGWVIVQTKGACTENVSGGHAEKEKKQNSIKQWHNLIIYALLKVKTHDFIV